MIYLKHDIENTIVVTLDELQEAIPSGVTATTHTLVLTNLQNESITTYDLTDISPNINRYNEFKLTIDDSLPSGYYNYEFKLKEVYTGSTNYIGGSLEIGKCLVAFKENSDVTYSGATNNIYVYKG